METIIKGGRLMLFLDNESSIPLATNHTLRISGELKDISNKDIASGKWSAQKIKQFSWECTTDNLYCENGIQNLYARMITGDPIDALFMEKEEADGTPLPVSGSWTPSSTQKGFSGKVRITSLEINATNGEDATYSATFTGYGELIRSQRMVDTPVFSPKKHTFTSSVQVSISCELDGATIYYTTDGTTPTSASTQYSSQITVSSTTTIKAIGVKADYLDSDVATMTYEKVSPPSPS